ncbi:MAG: thioredoxin family protein [Aureliella sp.]
MVRTASTMLPLGTEAPDFSLPDFNGTTVSRDDFRGKQGLLVIFMCNHCPYVKHVAAEVAKLAKEYQDKGVGVVGISSNDVEKYPDDSPEMMKVEAENQGYTFPYLVDDSQAVAKAYKAACTPDFYVFDAELKLAYRGQMDDSRPKQGSVPDGKDLRAALDALLAGEAIPEPQKPSIGCNIKWKEGAEPEYFNAAGIS